MHTYKQGLSLLGCLRQVSPRRDITFSEALRIAELQANKMLDYVSSVAGSELDCLWEQVIGSLPRVQVVYEALPVSGTSHWNGRTWIIALNPHESLARQRFTLLHEFKHIVDHGQVARLYTGDRRRAGREQAELAADYFAGCALVPKRLLKAAWGNGLQRPLELAEHFGVSVAAIQVRLAQTGLSIDRDRCARPVHTPRFAPQRFQAMSRGRSV
jgi:hypothetical protein